MTTKWTGWRDWMSCRKIIRQKKRIREWDVKHMKWNLSCNWHGLSKSSQHPAFMAIPRFYICFINIFAFASICYLKFVHKWCNLHLSKRVNAFHFSIISLNLVNALYVTFKRNHEAKMSLSSSRSLLENTNTCLVKSVINGRKTTKIVITNVQPEWIVSFHWIELTINQCLRGNQSSMQANNFKTQWISTG